MSARTCKNCTCSPGLLSRSNRKSALIARRINLTRLNSGSPGGSASRKGSVFTLDPSLCLPDTKEVNTSKRLESLRRKMKEHDLGVYIVPSEDQHQSEYVSAFDQKRSFISGFSGSAGIAIVTRDLNSVGDSFEGAAALSTDGRYFTQAIEELDFNWTLLKQGAKDEPNWKEWTVQQAAQLSLDSGLTVKIGVDPKVISYKLYQEFQSVIVKETAKNPKAKVEFVAVEQNLVGEIWHDFEELPASTLGEIKSLDIGFTGKSTKDKLAEVRKSLKDNIKGLVILGLDEVAWLLNLRGLDIEYNPVFYSFVIITEDATRLYIGENRLSENIVEELEKAGVTIEPYDSFYSSLHTLSKTFEQDNLKFLIPDNANWACVKQLSSGFTQGLSPVEDLKAVKNEVELAGAKIAHIRDGRALVRFFAWLEDQIINKQAMMDEIEADNQLTEYRKQEDNFVGLSFPTISATGANGAVIHYQPTSGQCGMINPTKMYLNDSGSQFLEGTTDVTRTMHFGEPSAEEIRNYTLVLKGNVALATLKFPENTTGNLIDSIARQFLWKYGLNYAHGTSHGVGSYLNVHEGPIGISPRPNAAAYALKAGNLISNEPGYYKEGEYGIRIETMMFVKESGMTADGKAFLEFETVTKVPFCRRLIDVDLLADEEIAWINQYHAGIWNDFHESFDKNSFVYKWLKRETDPLVKSH
ncbi:putative Xaa-Pro aminopeptidase FRA1 [Candida viswanathii]|uniref:Xaa-Pro aminopeptidase n=1 Tax=Candida viswanathii TaxID=5486 RepID=A0A367YMH5_9ASCO|nr:putative Xaa-Pro aminopeptidase FRA1 [Candida viswanathii]